MPTSDKFVCPECGKDDSLCSNGDDEGDYPKE